MRWPAFLLLCTTACTAGYGGPLPEIAVGTSQREVVIQGPPRVPEGELFRAFLVGTVMEVAAEVDPQPQATHLSESCRLQVESAFGTLPELDGVKTALLKAGYEQSPYAPLDDDWGRLWHFKKGQRLVLLLRLSEKEPCFDPEELMVLNERTAALPDILRRLALTPDEVTEADLALLRQASPLISQRFLAVTGDPAAFAELTRLRRHALWIIAGFVTLGLLSVWIVRKAQRR
ncbi:hypothetical protein [Prosthecobacter sp.]|uniref:hypothetical protein n=1 Tax=Prosthecobacter sp. TaxID=1965333 RepID=UPI0037834A67